MASKFLLLYGQLNLASLMSEERETIHKIRLLEEKAIKIFEYEKNNNRY